MTKGLRGFASMDPEKQRLIASKGGKAAHASGHAHRFTREEAIAAGRLGGQSRRKTKAVEPPTEPTTNEDLGVLGE